MAPRKTLEKSIEHNASVLLLKLLNGQVDASFKNPSLGSWVHQAARCGSNECLEALISREVNVDEEDGSGETPLQIASRLGHFAIVQTLLNANANIEKAQSPSTTPLVLACRGKWASVVKELLERGASIGCDQCGFPLAMLEAASVGSAEVISILLEHGVTANIDPRFNRVAVPASFQTPLHISAKESHAKAMHNLIKGGANVHWGSETKHSPLIAALQARQPAAVALLLANSVSTDFTMGNDDPLLIWVIKTCPHFGTIEELLKQGVSPDAFTRDRISALHLAVQLRELEILELLLKHGANPNVQDGNDSTPLHTSVDCNSIEAAKILVEEGKASLVVRDGRMLIPYLKAVVDGRRNMVIPLLRLNTTWKTWQDMREDIWSQDSAQWTAYSLLHNELRRDPDLYNQIYEVYNERERIYRQRNPSRCTLV